MGDVKRAAADWVRENVCRVSTPENLYSYDAFLAGAAWQREDILSLLRKGCDSSDYDTVSYSRLIKWLEKRLKISCDESVPEEIQKKYKGEK